ncbi:MAG: toll/interleukin-1 receptor domain-containing protein [Candidatus Marinimicrobia bacterium]|nr:toll/interleukin-1 receptor domain-containing protein [Candidatus Neomarinimicrobiota bacterium]
MTNTIFNYDFAISYAGEDKQIATEIFNALKEKYHNFNIFYAENNSDELVGVDGEKVFEKLFSNAKQVIVLFSENYKNKPWARFEWDIIRERNEENRCIPIRLDNVKILGLSSNFIYHKFSGDYEKVAEICIKKLVSWEKTNDIKRKSPLENMIDAFKDTSGATARAYQLVVDGRQRSRFPDLPYPKDNYTKTYNIIKIENSSFSKITRKVIRIDLPAGLSKKEVKFNIKYCTAEIFNKFKPDAIGLFVYCSVASDFIDYQLFNVARADFAPYGNWGRAEEGFAYNLPLDVFDWKIEFNNSYFNNK